MKASELTGTALDWAVECLENNRSPESTACEEDYSPSTNWSQGGPIIEREEISITNEAEGRWIGAIDNPEAGGEWDWRWNRVGPTPLIAAMRCYVASKLGDEVEIPEGLK